MSPAQSFTIGHDDVDTDDLRLGSSLPFIHDYKFGWDNECPTRLVDYETDKGGEVLSQ